MQLEQTFTKQLPLFSFAYLRYWNVSLEISHLNGITILKVIIPDTKSCIEFLFGKWNKKTDFIE
jgi:hypothetical protein